MNRIKRGTPRPDGKLFWQYQYGKELWVSPAQFDRNLISVREAVRKLNERKRREWTAELARRQGAMDVPALKAAVSDLQDVIAKIERLGVPPQALSSGGIQNLIAACALGHAFNMRGRRHDAEDADGVRYEYKVLTGDTINFVFPANGNINDAIDKKFDMVDRIAVLTLKEGRVVESVEVPQEPARAAAKAYFDILTNEPNVRRKLKPSARYWSTKKEVLAKLPGAVRKTFPTCVHAPSAVDSPPRP